MTDDQKNFEFVEVKGSKRFTFNAKYFRNPIFDTKIFNMADQIVFGYDGGMWDYCLWNDDVAFYRLCDGSKVQKLVNPHSGEEFIMDETLAGMIVTSYALNLELEWRPHDKGIDQLSALNSLIYEYAAEIGQFQQAFGLID
jgi:hypothetical protein